MAKKKAAKPKRGEYDKPLKVNASFAEIIEIAAKNANENSEKIRKAKASKKKA